VKECEKMNKEESRGGKSNRKEDVTEGKERTLFTMWAQHQIWKTRTEGNIELTTKSLIFQPGKLNRSKLNPAKEERKERSWDMKNIIGIKKKFPIFPWRYFEIQLSDGKSEVFVGRSRNVNELIDHLRSLGKKVL
jgi:hypothetical protein